jgi:hypothetical protein
MNWRISSTMVFVADTQAHDTHPGLFLTTDRRNGSSGRKIPAPRPTRSRACSISTSIWAQRGSLSPPADLTFPERAVRSQSGCLSAKLFQPATVIACIRTPRWVAVEDPLFMTATRITLEDVLEGPGFASYVTEPASPLSGAAMQLAPVGASLIDQAT